MPQLYFAVAICALPLAFCGCFETRGSDWMKMPLGPEDSSQHSRATNTNGSSPKRGFQTTRIGDSEKNETESDPSAPPSSTGQSLGIFRNTYYCFPRESDYSGPQAQVFNSQCTAIATVPQSFHDKLCIQGSGTLANGQTVSFAKRNCQCAAVCPRSGQKICYDALDPQRFPWGRGATGRAITPFRTIAVDSNVIALGSRVFIPAYAGIPMPDGSIHDGCFVAEDRGLAVSGNSIDVYTGSESATRDWNQRVHTGVGVEIYRNDSRCR